MSTTATTLSKTSAEQLKHTPFYELHRELGARMVPFSGYSMPLQFSDGIVKEHQRTRTTASFFDVSHMGQAVLSTNHGNFADTAALVERVMPGNIAHLLPGAMRYSVLLNEQGGIVDDLVVMRPPSNDANHDSLIAIFNASRITADCDHLAETAPELAVNLMNDRALFAVQGPAAPSVLRDVLDPFDPDSIRFMEASEIDYGGVSLFISRSGYTGEDGFEILVASIAAEWLARLILEHPDIRPAGLGARDSLRLEAGLCLYGQDLTETVTPIEAGLAWSIPKRRRAEANFLGADRVIDEIINGPPRFRVGLIANSKSLPRAGMKILNQDGTPIGRVTSGGFAPTIAAPIAMGYVAASTSHVGRQVWVEGGRGRLAAQITSLPFLPPRTARGEIYTQSTK